MTESSQNPGPTKGGNTVSVVGSGGRRRDYSDSHLRSIDFKSVFLFLSRHHGLKEEVLTRSVVMNLARRFNAGAGSRKHLRRVATAENTLRILGKSVVATRREEPPRSSPALKRR